jgi:metal-responsive CopG/Arc/MetJ family transcriptional regulator
MGKSTTVELSAEISAELDAWAAKNGTSRNEAVQDAVREFLFFRRCRDLRTRMMGEAQAQGLYTDEDVFNRIS